MTPASRSGGSGGDDVPMELAIDFLRKDHAWLEYERCAFVDGTTIAPAVRGHKLGVSLAAGSPILLHEIGVTYTITIPMAREPKPGQSVDDRRSAMIELWEPLGYEIVHEDESGTVLMVAALFDNLQQLENLALRRQWPRATSRCPPCRCL